MVTENVLTPMLSAQAIRTMQKRKLPIDDWAIIRMSDDIYEYMKLPLEVRKIFMYVIQHYCNSHVRVHKMLHRCAPFDIWKFYTTPYDNRVLLQLPTWREQKALEGRSILQDCRGEYLRDWQWLSIICEAPEAQTKHATASKARECREKYEQHDDSELYTICKFKHQQPVCCYVVAVSEIPDLRVLIQTAHIDYAYHFYSKHVDMLCKMIDESDEMRERCLSTMGFDFDTIQKKGDNLLVSFKRR